MTNFIDKASLIMIPSAYGEGKLSCVKPTDGSGDFNFTRASSAIRTNPDGYLEPACYNLLSYSEEFDNVIWTKIRATVSANEINSPIGVLNADKIASTETSNNGCIVRSQLISQTGIKQVSIYVKPNTSQYFQIHRDFGAGVVFNLSNGTVKQETNATGTITSEVDGWFKCTATFTTEGSGYFLFIAGNSSMTTVTWSSTINQNLFVWGAQLTQGSTIKPYQKTTDRLNVPRLDYSNGATCPSLLIEPQRTNLLTYSEVISNGNWTRVGDIGVLDNSTISPNQQLTASKITNNTSLDFISQISNGTTGLVYSFSIFIKNFDANRTLIRTRNATTVQDAFINWSGNTITSITNTTGNLTFESLTNGWYKITTTYTAIETVQRTRVYTDDSTGGKSVYIWGAQLEQGTYPTSYIPTTTTAVTRIADVCSKSGISSLIGQTEGTVYLEINVNKSMIGRPFTNIITLQDAIANFLNIYIDPSISSIRVRVRKDNGSITDIMLKNISIGTLKIAVKYINGNYKLFLNGILESTSTDSTNFPTPPLNTLVLSDVNFGSNSYPTKNIMLFKTQLTDQECMDLTTL